MNVMTEEEAKGRACCGSGNRPAENGPCIASACMAWRWQREYRYTHVPCEPNDMRAVEHVRPEGPGWQDTKNDDDPTIVYRNYDNGRRASVALWSRDHVGFCGLAGRPTP